MREIWSTPVTLFLDDIDSENKLPEEPLDPEAAQTLLSELNYAGGGHEHSETVLASLNDFFISKKVNSIQLLMSHLETFASSGEINNMRLAFNKINISTEIKPEHKQTSNSSTHILKELMKSNSGAKEALPHTPAATPLSHISAPVSGNKSEMKPIDITDVTPINNPNERPRMGR